MVLGNKPTLMLIFVKTVFAGVRYTTSEMFALRGNYTPYQKFACFVHYLKIILSLNFS